MSAETIMPLTFATFFICGVKDLTNYTQRTCVNLLLKGILSEKAKEGGVGVIGDTDCTNYVKGERKLSADIQIDLNNLSSEEIIKRVKRINFRDPANAADALRVLVKNSSLSEKDKNTLLKNYQKDQEGQELKFIAEVFMRSVKEDNRHRLTQEQKDILLDYRNYHSLSDDKNGTSAISAHQKLTNRAEADLHVEIEDTEDLGWMGNYVSASKIKKPIMPAGREVAIRYSKINLPEEYSRMVYILKPALMEANVRKYAMNDFIKVLSIDITSNSLQEGKLECWQFEGAIDLIPSLLTALNFSDACGFVLQPVGVFELSQIENVEEVLRAVSNVNVSICSPLIYKDVPDFKLILLVHRSERKAKEQRLDTEHDKTRVYEMTRKL